MPKNLTCISVVHDRAEIVFHAEGIRVSLLMEVISVRSLNVFVIDLQRIVPVKEIFQNLIENE